MKILVTGGAGYIGSHTIIELLQAGYEVISADNFLNSSSKTFERIKQITGKEVYNYEIDLCDQEAVEIILDENPDIKGIIHFAALKSVPESVQTPLHYYDNNLNSLINVLRQVYEHQIPYFVFSSSCSVYGNVKTLPVNEKTIIAGAASPYGFTKIFGEQIVNDFYKIHNKQSNIILRYFNPVGAHPSGLIGENPTESPNNLVPVITQTAAGIRKQMTVFGKDHATRDGSCLRDYVHVTDIAKAHVKAIQFLEKSVNPQSALFNLGTGKGITVLEAIAAFEKVSGLKLNYKIGERRDGDVEAIYSDSSLAQQQLGWKPEYDIEAMMRTAWVWQQNLMKEV